MEPDDSTLWSRARSGDADAFGTLFERHANTIYNYCFRRVADWALAEDLLSVVFLEAWRQRDKALPPEKFLPWLYGIATNVVRNQRRSQRRYGAALRRMPPGDQHEYIDDDLQLQSVVRRVKQLPRHEQEVFALCAWFDLSYEDAALALAIPVGTVRSRLSRARARLRELDPARPQPVSEVSSRGR